ncbi:hypothetical protein [Actinomadura macra]|uniref:hypothetical protein n=1 Tax=Actinomadura macra TaxID=46164 RepID=UPI000A9578F1|nr:hypothetical protein [Actinomadura macra]
MFLRRCGFFAFWSVLGLFLVRQPENAAHAVEAIFGALAVLADAFSRFVAAF